MSSRHSCFPFLISPSCGPQEQRRRLQRLLAVSFSCGEVVSAVVASGGRFCVTDDGSFCLQSDERGDLLQHEEDEVHIIREGRSAPLISKIRGHVNENWGQGDNSEAEKQLQLWIGRTHLFAPCERGGCSLKRKVRLVALTQNRAFSSCADVIAEAMGSATAAGTTAEAVVQDALKHNVTLKAFFIGFKLSTMVALTKV